MQRTLSLATGIRIEFSIPKFNGLGRSAATTLTKLAFISTQLHAAATYAQANLEILVT